MKWKIVVFAPAYSDLNEATATKQMSVNRRREATTTTTPTDNALEILIHVDSFRWHIYKKLENEFESLLF